MVSGFYDLFKRGSMKTFKCPVHPHITNEVCCPDSEEDVPDVLPASSTIEDSSSVADTVPPTVEENDEKYHEDLQKKADATAEEYATQKVEDALPISNSNTEVNIAGYGAKSVNGIEPDDEELGGPDEEFDNAPAKIKKPKTKEKPKPKSKPKKKKR